LQFNQRVKRAFFNPDNNAFFILVYSDFYEIPLPALRFEKVEETNTKVKNDTEENNAFQIDHVRRTQESSETTKTTLSKEK
jgi:hypothetical protein